MKASQEHISSCAYQVVQYNSTCRDFGTIQLVCFGQSRCTAQSPDGFPSGFPLFLTFAAVA
jgi:hypothetical protein